MGLHYALGCICRLGALHSRSTTFDGGLVSLFARSQIALVNTVLMVSELMKNFEHQFLFKRVEFQSKFYKGEGYPFIPFSFDVILAEAEIKE